MTHTQKNVDNLYITINEDNNTGKAFFHLTNLNRT